MMLLTRIQSIITEWKDVTERISKIHTSSEPIFLPVEFIQNKLLPVILVVAVCLSVIYTICLKFIVVYNDNTTTTTTTTTTTVVDSKLKQQQQQQQQRNKRIKICYQITNIIFNIAIGSIGLYLEYVVLPTLDVYDNHNDTTTSYSSSVDKILGLENELYLVSAFQLGYQLWAIPVGILHVGEDMTMILHHLAVVISCSMTGFLSIGFRYYSPFFYGVMELSSIPLSIMNTFKDNPHLQKQYPTWNGISRIFFVISFLWIRVIMCLSRWPIFLRDNFLVFYTKQMGIYKLYMFVQWLLATFLAILQLYWATLILKGVVKQLGGGGGGGDKKEQKKSKKVS